MPREGWRGRRLAAALLRVAAGPIARVGPPHQHTHAMVTCTSHRALLTGHRGFWRRTDAALGAQAHTCTAREDRSSSSAMAARAEESSSEGTDVHAVPPQDPWDDLRGLTVTAKPSHPHDAFEDHPIAIGHLVERIAGHTYRVKLEPPKRTWRAWPEPHKATGAPTMSSPSTTSAPPADSAAVAGAASDIPAPSPSQVPGGAAATAPASPSPSAIPDQTQQDESCLFDSAVPLTLEIGTRIALVYDEDFSPPTAAAAAVTAASAAAGESGYDAVSALSMNMEGLVVRVNGNTTYTVLMDNGEVELSVEPRRLLRLPPGKPTSLVHSQLFLDLQAWLRSCVTDYRDCEAAALILFKRGWRLPRMFLLERGDLAALTFIPHLQREAVVEKAQWERDYYHVMRNLRGERIKDRDYRYAISKYKGTISCIIGILVVSYVFISNLRAYDRQQRGYQLRVAARAIANGGLATSQLGGTGADGHDGSAQVVARPEEEEKMARVFRQLDAAHPRIVVVTGFAGNGKSALCRRVMEQEGLPAVFVYVRGGSEDTLRSIVRSLGVLNVEVCGDLMDFLSEAIREARNVRGAANVLARTRRAKPKNGPTPLHERDAASPASSAAAAATAAASTAPDDDAAMDVASLPPASSSGSAHTPNWSSAEGQVPLMVSAPAALGSSETAGPHVLPIVYIKLLDAGRLEKAYREAVGLVVDHQVCHLVFEVPMESLTAQARRLARLDFYTVPNFTRPQAFKYMLNVMEPTDMAFFVEVVGTNCNDLDELYAAVRQRGVDTVTYTSQKLMKGMRRLHAAATLFAHDDKKRTAQDVLVALQKLASVPFDQGRPTKQVPEIMALGHHAFFKDILLYDPLRDRWFFSQQVLHTAARCLYCAPPAEPA